MQSSEKINSNNVTTSRSGTNSLSSSQSNSGDESSRLLSSSNADYDHIKNTTLMFFLDRLYIASKDGKEARTLHDLSCLFGTKEFTKEMRQIVGASRNGLKKFLQSYPSLFTIEGDKVYLTQLKQEAQAPARDYHQEAVDYFREKLQQFGTSFVPIRNLFGYRSQANQEVRHVSGKNAREFRQFLSAHDDVFEIVADEHVVLKSALQELESRGEAYPSLQQLASQPPEGTTMDPYLNKQFAHMVEDCIREKVSGAGARITVEQLHALIMDDCQNQLFLKMVKTVEDLKVFLRMHPKLFKRSNSQEVEYVALLTEDERKELELKTHPPQQLMRQHSTLHRSETMESSLSDRSSTAGQPMSLPPQSANDGGCGFRQLQPTSFEQPMSLIGKSQQHETRRSSSGGQHSSSLRANAPPFVPSSWSQNRRQQSSAKSSQQQPPVPLQRSQSSLASGQRQSARAAIDPRSAIRSYLFKASATNASNTGPYSPAKMSNGGTHQQPLQTQKQVHRANGLNGEDLRARTVNIVREASNIITRIMNSVDAVAFDCKGYNLGFNGEITLIQLAFLPKQAPQPPATQPLSSRPYNHHLAAATTSSRNGQQTIAIDNNSENSKPSQQVPTKQKPEVCIFDLITNPELAYCLKPLLESEQIVKVVHDVRNKSNALFSQFGIMLKHVFDTQVANLVIQQQETGKPAYKSRYISMGKLCEIYGDDSLAKYRNLIKSKTRYSSGAGGVTSSSSTSSGKNKDVNYWRSRPLTDAMVYESTMDVYCLVDGVYQNLRDKILPEYWQLFEQLSLEGVLARIKPEEIRNVKKERKIDLEVIDLKRKLYSDSTSAIVLSNREIRLLRHVDLTPEVRQKIQQCKKVAKKLERLDMKSAQQNEEQQHASLQQSIESSEHSGEHQLQQRQLQSMDQQLASVQTNISSLVSSSPSSSSTSSAPSSATFSDAGLAGESSQRVVAKSPDLGETGMTDLMDSSMFDELKDRMIESSSLLESFANEDDDDVDVEMQQHQAELHSYGSHDNCKCNCHHSKSVSSGSSINGSIVNDSTLAVKQTTTSTKPDQTDEGRQEVEKEDGCTESSSSKAVDMAVQCDLLS